MASNINSTPMVHPASPRRPSIESISVVGSNAAPDSPHPPATPIVDPSGSPGLQAAAADPNMQPSSDAVTSLPLTQQVFDAMGLVNKQEIQLDDNVKRARKQIIESEASLALAKRDYQQAVDMRARNAAAVQSKRIVSYSRTGSFTYTAMLIYDRNSATTPVAPMQTWSRTRALSMHSSHAVRHTRPPVVVEQY